MSKVSEEIKTVEEAQSWSEAVGPLVARFHASHALGGEMLVKGPGLIAIAALLASMARRLDNLGVDVSGDRMKAVKDMTEEEFQTFIATIQSKRVDNHQ